jgi:hypothetical protein
LVEPLDFDFLAHHDSVEGRPNVFLNHRQETGFLFGFIVGVDGRPFNEAF